MLEGDFGWSDVGSWDCLDAVRPKDEKGNIVSGDTALLDTKNCVIYGKHKLIAAIGVKDLVVVEGENAVLVCPVWEAQRVKEIVERLAQSGEDRFL